MLLAIDIGNTNISFGLFKGKRLFKRFDIPAQHYSLGALKKSLGKTGIADCVICSVVPALCRRLKADLRKISDGEACLVGEDFKVPLKNLYRKPHQVGGDRLLNAYAGTWLYGAPLIIVDFGTAVTFDVISKRKEYLGGMILPGLDISLDALAEKTALLPKIKLAKPREFIGRDTESSMLSGLIYGFAALTEQFTEKIKDEIGDKAKIIGTGGAACLINKHSRVFDAINKDLTLIGLCLVYYKIFSLTRIK